MQNLQLQGVGTSSDMVESMAAKMLRCTLAAFGENPRLRAAAPLMESNDLGDILGAFTSGFIEQSVEACLEAWREFQTIRAAPNVEHAT